MAKRPVGLGKAAKQKKHKGADGAAVPAGAAKNAEPPADGAAAAADGADGAAAAADAALEIDIDDADDAAGDAELAEVYGLFKFFDAATSDTQRLAHGLVHECDALLRAREQQLPPRFYLAYGLALLTLARFQDSVGEADEDKGSGSGKAAAAADADADADSAAAFIAAALERFDEGLAEDAAHANLRLARALALIEQVEERLRAQPKARKHAGIVLKARARVELAADELEAAGAAAGAAEKRRADAAAALAQFAAALATLPPRPELAALQTRLLGAARDAFAALADSAAPEIARAANKGLGTYHLARAAPLLASLEEDSDEEDAEPARRDAASEADATAARTELTRAIAFLDKAQAEADPETYVEAAEARISLGNLEENDSPAQQTHYAQAARLLKKAQRLGAGDFAELIEAIE